LRQTLVNDAVEEEKQRGLKREREEVDAGAESDAAEELAAPVFVSQDVLEATVKRMKIAELPLREACMAHGCTVTSDGWDDSGSNHYINFLVTTVHGSFFDGTVRLGSNDSEKAQDTAGHIADEIKRVGALNVV
ncbi:MAG: hypothetical protein SGPRY_002917, partial [Prymnesium sp.]